MQGTRFFSVLLCLCATCSGSRDDGHGSAPPDASSGGDHSEDVDASTVPGPDGSIIIIPPSDGSVIVIPTPDGLSPPDRGGPIIGPDGSISWPRSDSAVPTPDADSWDAGTGCPRSIPNAGESCVIDTGCVYPADCCGILAGYVHAHCLSGTWHIVGEPNGDLCSPCVPFPLAGEICSLEAACQSGPPPICLTRLACYATPVVARCINDRWAIIGQCSK